MSLSVAVIDALVATGATVEQLAAAVKADMAEAEQRIIEKRAKDAERQRRHRLSRAVTVTPSDERDPPMNISNPHETPVEAKASTAPKGRERGTKIPEDWEAPPIAELTDEAKALAALWPAVAYRAEAEAFRNFWIAETRATSRKSNWNRAWCNRIVAVNGKVMREAKFAPPTLVADNRPLSIDELKRAIAFNEDQGNVDKAKVYRFQLEARQALAR